jgi:hypothetical protein
LEASEGVDDGQDSSKVAVSGCTVTSAIQIAFQKVQQEHCYEEGREGIILRSSAAQVAADSCQTVRAPLAEKLPGGFLLLQGTVLFGKDTQSLEDWLGTQGESNWRRTRVGGGGEERPQTGFEVVNGFALIEGEVEASQRVLCRQAWLAIGHSLGRALLPAKQDFVVAAVGSLRTNAATARGLLEITLYAPLLAWPAGALDCAAPLG